MAIIEAVEAPTGSRRRYRLYSPATLEKVGEFEVATEVDVRDALESARKAQPGWAELGFDERARYIYRALDALVERQDEFIEAAIRETGKARSEAIAVEILACCDSMSFHAKRAEEILRTRKRPMRGLRGLTRQLRVVYRPLGVVGIITPWNAPLLLSLTPTVQALMAGNAVLLKPSEFSPYTGRLVGNLFEAAGLPDGLLCVLLGDGETGAALAEAGVDKIDFTGSVATGRKVAEACARQLIPCTMEFGGKDPMIVCADAHLDRAVSGAIAGAFLNAGQLRWGTERVYVVDDVFDEFTRKVVKQVAELRQGAEGEFDVGAIITREQLEVIERQVEDAISKGARVLAGGRRNPDLPGLFYEPTVIVDVDHDMEVMRDETFGPVLPIVRVRDEEQAIRLANDTRYGQGGSVWTRDRRKGCEIAKRLEAGGVCVNETTITCGVQEASSGGRKESGLGQVKDEVGLRSYCHALPIVIERFGRKRARGSYPYRRKSEDRLQKLIRFMWRSRLGRWLS
jgi:succinate-semialdehyde dehydrogenase/glutarate-semialdehyde dehydrogenase